jgi:polar amino acid transport system permease protein
MISRSGIASRGRRLVGKDRSPLVDLTQFVVFIGGLVWLSVHGAQSMGYVWQWYRVSQYLYRIIDGELIWGPLIRGFQVTIEISILSLFFTIIIGLVTAIFRMSDSPAARLLARVYLEVIRNSPLLVQLYLFYFVLSPILDIDRYWIGIFCLAFFEGAYASEIFRAGFLSVNRGQWETGASLGLSKHHVYRYVVLPQAVPLIMPPLTGLSVSLIKNSSIISVIAIFELTAQGQNIIADTFMSFEIWLTVAAMYLMITVSLSLLVNLFEVRMKARSKQ